MPCRAGRAEEESKVERAEEEFQAERRRRSSTHCWSSEQGVRHVSCDIMLLEINAGPSHARLSGGGGVQVRASGGVVPRRTVDHCVERAEEFDMSPSERGRSSTQGLASGGEFKVITR